MSTSDNFEIAFKKLEQEMHAEAQSLNTKKAELKKIQDEIFNFRAENMKQKQAIQERERKITENDSKKRKLEDEIRKLEEKQKKDHLELTRIEGANRDRLTQHGIKLTH